MRPYVLGLLLALNPTFLQAKTLQACMALWPPYVTKDQDGSPTGLHTEILQEMVSALGYKVEIEALPWKRCLKMAERGEVDIVYSASFDKERAEYLHYPKQHLHETHYVFVIDKNAAHGWDQGRDVTKLPQPIGAVNGYSATVALDDFEGIYLDDGAASDEINIAKFSKGRVKTILIEKKALAHLKEDLHKAHEVLDPPFQQKKYYIALSRKAFGNENEAKEFVRAMDAYLTQSALKGELERAHDQLAISTDPS